MALEPRRAFFVGPRRIQITRAAQAANMTLSAQSAAITSRRARVSEPRSQRHIQGFELSQVCEALVRVLGKHVLWTR